MAEIHDLIGEKEVPTWDEAIILARRAIYDTDGRGMIARNRNYLQDRVAREIQSAVRNRASDGLLLARIAELEAVLKPFAEIGGHMGRTPIQRAVSVGYLGVEADGLNSHARSTATVADFRAARDVLQRSATAVPASKP